MVEPRADLAIILLIAVAACNGCGKAPAPVAAQPASTSPEPGHLPQFTPTTKVERPKLAAAAGSPELPDSVQGAVRTLNQSL
jgi:hypothetical protein